MDRIPRMLIYRNAVSVKLKNKRVTVVDDQNANGVQIDFLICDGAKDRRSLHKVLRGKVVKTSIKLSHEAFEALVAAYEELTKTERYTK